MSITRIKKNKVIIIFGYGFLSKTLIRNFIKKKKFKIFCIIKSNYKDYDKFKDVNYLKISEKRKIQSIRNPYLIINTLGNINHDKFNSASEKKIHYEHYAAPRKILSLIQYKSETIFIQVGSIDEIDQIKKNKHYITPYALYKNYFSKYLLSLKFNKLIDARIIYINSVFGPYQKKNRLIPMAIEFLIKSKKFTPTFPNRKRNFIFSEQFSKSLNVIIDNIDKFKNQIIIKSKFDYKISNIISYIFTKNNNNIYIRKFKSINKSYRDTEYFFVKEDKNINKYLDETINHYLNV